MLGKLFSTAASTLSPRGSTPSSSRPTTSLESVQEDIHTRSLLFPDADTLYQHHHDQVFPLPATTVPILTCSNPFDVNSEIDIDVKDVRVVIMQEATSHMNSAILLFDSHPLFEPSSERQSATSTRSIGRGSMSSARRVSIGQISKPVVIQENAGTRNFGAFDRRPSAHARTPSYAETDGQRSAREYKEEMNTFSSCMFGASDIMAYKGTGTKVHILSPETKSSTSPFADGGHGSLGRSSLRNSKLSQSFTSETISPTPTSSGLSGTSSGSRMSDKRRVLVTRIFPVTLHNSEEEEAEGRTPTVGDATETSCFSLPNGDGDDRPKEKKPKPTQKRTPMYAIGLIVQLPASTNPPPFQSSKSGFRGAGSYTEGDSFPSSFSSLKPAGWTVLGGYGMDSLESSFLSDVDDRIDSVTQHWDIIMRTMSQVQALASKEILALLNKVDIASPNPGSGNFGSQNTRVPTASVSISGKRVEETVKPFKLKTNVKWVQLSSNALAHHERIRQDIENSRQRIASGIKTLQVVTRQGRWGIWREEARWVSKWAGGKEDGVFFHNLLTVFLGNHTEWLQALGPDWYRRRHYQQQRANRDEELPILARTVIVAQDKMAARRLLFLLSAFLPPNQQLQLPLFRQYRPNTAQSFGGYSQSPPSFISPNLREESLRRRANRLNYPRNPNIRRMSIPSQAPNGVELNQTEVAHERRGSDASILKTANLPIPGSDGRSRKSSAATTMTVTPVNTLAHLSNRRPIRGTGPFPRPGSRGSFATEDLMKSLRRNDSTGNYSSMSSDSQGQSRWGTLTSFWSSKRRSSTTTTDLTIPSVEGIEIEEEQKELKKGQLVKMVEEANKDETEAPKDTTQVVSVEVVEPPEPQVRSGGIFESPVKTSVNEYDGVIDIDVPLPDFITSSFGSAISSPSSSGILSSHGIGPGLEGFEHYSPYGPDEENPLNVGGWLPTYHPDFVLQAIPTPDRKTYNLEEEIKLSMRAEPTPAIIMAGHGSNHWTDITSTIIADASTFTIKRLRLRRLIRRKSFNADTFTSNPSSFDGKPNNLSMYGNPYLSQPAPSIDAVNSIIEEEFIEDNITSMDKTLIEALEKITTQSGDRPSTSLESEKPSRESSRVRSNDKDARETRKNTEVPRNECRKILLSALEEIAREVAEARSDGEDDNNNDVDGPTAVTERKQSPLREGIRGWLDRVEYGH